MSKFRALLASLAAVGIVAALGVGGVLSVSSTTAHSAQVRVESLKAQSICYNCVD